MTSARPVGVVVDTMVISWLLYERPSPVADRYRALIETKTVLLAFQTVMELRYGALRAGWGELRRRTASPGQGTAAERTETRRQDLERSPLL